MAKILVNIDVPELEAAVTFYTSAFALAVGRRFGNIVELLGAEAPIYLIEKPAGTPTAPSAPDARRYSRHWTPVHLDFVVDDIDAAVERAEAAGARVERPVSRQDWGSLALLADPFGHGVCLVEFSAEGYDALVGTPRA